jgi:hypothetical protein
MDGRADTADVVLLRSLARIALLAFWALVGWGWLLLILTVIGAMGEGLGPALARLLPLRDHSTWAWVNAFSAALALAVGIVVGGVVLWSRRQGSPSAPAASPGDDERPGPLPPAS